MLMMGLHEHQGHRAPYHQYPQHERIHQFNGPIETDQEVLPERRCAMENEAAVDETIGTGETNHAEKVVTIVVVIHKEKGDVEEWITREI